MTNYVVGGRTIWRSPNKKWGIDVPKDSTFFTGYRAVNRILEVGVSDGWIVYYVNVNKDGKIVEDEMFEYRVPRYVREKTYAVLKKVYQNYKMGKKLY